MAAVQSNTPALPWDICEEIINAFWWSLVTNRDRTKFMVSSSLVSKTWRDLYMLISLRDIHITRPKFATNMMYIGTDLFRFEYDPTLNDRAGPLVRSITWHMEYSASRACTPEEVAERGMGGCVNVCMYTLNNFPDMFPNLRRVRLEYRNYPYADLFHNLRLYHLPPIIEAVDVRYRFDENVSEEVMELQRREQDLTHFAPWELKNVREMSIIGGTKAVAKELLSHTPNLKQLTIDRDCAARLRIRANADDPKYCRVTLV